MTWLKRLKVIEQAPVILQTPLPINDPKQFRLARLTNKGLSLDEAKEVTQRLDLRTQGDDRILCYACNHLKGYINFWRCGNWKLANIGVKESHAKLPNEMVDLLQRCNGFYPLEEFAQHTNEGLSDFKRLLNHLNKELSMDDDELAQWNINHIEDPATTVYCLELMRYAVNLGRFPSHGWLS